MKKCKVAQELDKKRHAVDAPEVEGYSNQEIVARASQRLDELDDKYARHVESCRVCKKIKNKEQNDSRAR